MTTNFDSGNYISLYYINYVRQGWVWTCTEEGESAEAEVMDVVKKDEMKSVGVRRAEEGTENS